MHRSQKRTTLKRGFSLNELLVVIAIMGILASITLISVDSARRKGKDTAIKAHLASIQIEAEVYYTLHSNVANAYGNAIVTGNPSSCIGAAGNGQNVNTLFGGDTLIKNTLQTIKGIVGTGAGSMQCSSHVYVAADGTGPDYTIFVRLTNGTYWCVDSRRFAGVATLPPVNPGDARACI